jgi:biotin carboxylase
MTKFELPIGIFYEHPDWFRPLFAELDRRGTAYVRLDAANHQYEVDGEGRQYALLFNRMSASAYLRGHGNAIFYTRSYLSHIESTGTRVVNGVEAFSIETSKALQLSLLASLGLPFPRSRVINHATQAKSAARDLKFPIIVKPNIGGRGAGIVRYDSLDALESAVDAGLVDLGIDSTALVQEFAAARGGHIVRVETLAGKYLYAMKVYTTGENFNLCPAEICQIESGGVAIGEMCLADAPKAGLQLEAYTPPSEIIEAVERIVEAARIDVGGIEYLIDDTTGKAMFYDINALSNFVADAPRVIGFDPHVRLVDYLEEEAQRCATVTGSPFLAVG